MASVAWRATNNQPTVTDQVTTHNSTPTTTQKAQNAPALTWPSTSPENLDALANDLKASGCSPKVIADLLAPAFHQEASLPAAATFLRMRRDQFPWAPAPGWEAFAGDPEDFGQIEEAHSQRMSEVFGPLSGDDDEDKSFDDWPRYRSSINDNAFAGLSPDLESQLLQLREERSQELKRLRRLADRESDEAIHDRMVAMKSEQREQLLASGNHDASEITEYARRTSPYSRIVRDVTGIRLNDDEMRTIVDSLESPDGLQVIRFLLGDERFQVFQSETEHPLSKLKDDTSIGHLLE